VGPTIGRKNERERKESRNEMGFQEEKKQSNVIGMVDRPIHELFFVSLFFVFLFRRGISIIIMLTILFCYEFVIYGTMSCRSTINMITFKCIIKIYCVLY
jgi:hypothetical protein